MKKLKNFPQFTHFASIPFINPEHRAILGGFQDRIEQIFKLQKLEHTIKRSNTNLMHITLSMLTLNLQQYRQKTKEIIKKLDKEISEILKGSAVTLGDIKYFTRYNRNDKKNYVTLFYFDFETDEHIEKINKVTDLVIREMVQAEIINPNELKSMHIKYDHKTGKYTNDQHHMTLFRVQDLVEDQKFQEIFKKIQALKNQQKQEKISLACHYVDISTRFHFDETNFYEPLARVNLSPDL